MLDLYFVLYFLKLIHFLVLCFITNLTFFLELKDGASPITVVIVLSQ